METRQMTIFSFIFSALTGCNIHFCVSKYSKSIFMWSTIYFILVCEILQLLSKSYQFGQLMESRHPEVTKDPYYVLLFRRRQILILLGSSLWTIKV